MGLGVPAFSNTQLNKAQDSRWLFMTISTGSIKMMFYDCNYSLNQPVELLEESHREVSSTVITVKCDKNRPFLQGIWH